MRNFALPVGLSCVALASIVVAGDGSKPIEVRVGELEARVSALERRAVALPAGTAAPTRPFSDLEDPRKVTPPKGAPERVGFLYGEWLGAYMEAFAKNLERDMLARNPGAPGTAHAELRSRDLKLAREDLALLVAACERAREAYLAAGGK